MKGQKVFIVSICGGKVVAAGEFKKKTSAEEEQGNPFTSHFPPA